jgi:hypothetical protein
VIDGRVIPQYKSSGAAVLPSACITDWLYRLHRNTGDHTRLMRVMETRTGFPGRKADRNGMKHAGLMNGPGGSMIVQWRMNDVDGKDSAAIAPSDAASGAPADGSRRRPSPTKAVPVRPAATAEWRPAPRVTRSPDISGAGIGYPAAIPIGIEVSVLCNSGLPHLTLTGDVIPASVGIQIGPAVALISCVTVARARMV